MEFWGVEVKSGKPCSVELSEPRVVHLSQACLGEGKDKGNEPIYLYVTINEKKIVLGTLSPNKFPQQQFDLMFEKSFELSHSWKNGTVNFFGYECDQLDESDLSDYGSDSESGEDTPVPVAYESSGKPVAEAAKPKLNLAGVADEFDTDSSDEEDDSDEEESSESDGSEAEINEDKEETPNKVEKVSKKRPVESASETPAKKAKLVTPKRTGEENKKASVHVATPYPSKQAGKTSSNQSKQKTPESAGSHLCKPCKRPFKSEKALESHSKDKHSDRK